MATPLSKNYSFADVFGLVYRGPGRSESSETVRYRIDGLRSLEALSHPDMLLVLLVLLSDKRRAWLHLYPKNAFQEVHFAQTCLVDELCTEIGEIGGGVSNILNPSGLRAGRRKKRRSGVRVFSSARQYIQV